MRRSEAGSTLQELLLRAVDFPGTGLRLLDRGERATFLSWTGIAERASAVAGGPGALGVAPGERVALLDSTGAEVLDRTTMGSHTVHLSGKQHCRIDS